MNWHVSVTYSLTDEEKKFPNFLEILKKVIG